MGSREHKANCRCAFCYHVGPPSHKANCSCPFCVPLKGRKPSVETKAKISRALSGRSLSHKLDCTCSFCHTENCTCVHCTRTFELTKLELELANFLIDSGYDLVPQVQFGRYRVDFYEPNRHIAFEADGDGWHANRKEYDSNRDAVLMARFSLPVIRFNQTEIKSFERI